MDSKLYRRREMLGVKDSLIETFSNLYDPKKKEFLGRDYIRWGQLIAFYLAFYVILISFFMGLYNLWFKVMVNKDDPLYSGPEEGLAWTPGVSFVPLLDPERKSTFIRWDRNNDTQIKRIIKTLYDDFLKQYEEENWDSENGNFIDCTQGRTDPNPQKVCKFKLDWLLPCRRYNGYGWADGQPCIIFKLNKINFWKPENYDSIDEVPEEIRDIWRPNVIAFKCFGDDPISKEWVKQINYYPMPGWSFHYYPFLGQQGYKSPLVAAEFKDIPVRTMVFITCKAYTKNMIYESAYRLGQVTFEILND